MLVYVSIRFAKYGVALSASVRRVSFGRKSLDVRSTWVFSHAKARVGLREVTTGGGEGDHRRSTVVQWKELHDTVRCMIYILSCAAFSHQMIRLKKDARYLAFVFRPIWVAIKGLLTRGVGSAFPLNRAHVYRGSRRTHSGWFHALFLRSIPRILFAVHSFLS